MLFPKLLHRKAKRREGPTLHGRPATMGELRHYVIFDRDRVCVAFALDVSGHECRDSFGTPHAPWDLTKLELAHVPGRGENAFGRKAPDDEWHGVAECHSANANVSSKLREFERIWIVEREGRRRM